MQLTQTSQKNFQKTHDSPVISALFNSNFHQVVSGAQSGMITIWDPSTGSKIFQFSKLHGVSSFYSET
jgi:WD40 repeat protein